MAHLVRERVCVQTVTMPAKEFVDALQAHPVRSSRCLQQ